MPHLKIKIGEYGIVLNKQNNFIIVQLFDYPSKWMLPGGRLEDDDDAIEGVKRELKEETNLNIEVIFPVHAKRWGFKPKKYAVFFLCRAVSGKIKLNHEVKEYKWIGFDEIDKIKWLSKSFRPAIINAKRLIDRGF